MTHTGWYFSTLILCLFLITMPIRYTQLSWLGYLFSVVQILLIAVFCPPHFLSGLLILALTFVIKPYTQRVGLAVLLSFCGAIFPLVLEESSTFRWSIVRRPFFCLCRCGHPHGYKMGPPHGRRISWSHLVDSTTGHFGAAGGIALYNPSLRLATRR